MLKITVFVVFSLGLLFESGESRKSPVTVIAHRGASGYLPEHTLESKSLAFLMQSDFLEQDLVLTRDGVPIVLHDIYLDEITDVADKYPTRFRQLSDGKKRYYAIDFDLSEIKTLKVSERYDPNDKMKPTYPDRFPLWKSTFRLHTFREEIELILGLQKSFGSIYALDKQNSEAYTRIGLYTELKRPKFHRKESQVDFSRIVLDTLREFNLTTREDKVIIQCFDPDELRYMKEALNSSLRMVQLLWPVIDVNPEGDEPVNYTYWNSEAGLRELRTFVDGIGPEKDQLIELDESGRFKGASHMYKTAKELKLFMHPYTFRVDRLPKYARSYGELIDIFYKRLNVEGVFSDFPDLTIKYLDDIASSNGSPSLWPRKKYHYFNLIAIAFCTIFFSYL